MEALAFVEEEPEAVALEVEPEPVAVAELSELVSVADAVLDAAEVVAAGVAVAAPVGC